MVRWTEDDVRRVQQRHAAREDVPGSPLTPRPHRPRSTPKTRIISEAASRKEAVKSWGANVPRVNRLATSMPRSKYRSKSTTVNGHRFPSKLEADRYRELVAMQKAGVVLWFVRHPRFDLPGGIKYEADFLVGFQERCRVEQRDIGAPYLRVAVEDCKGHETEVFKIKRRQFAECYPHLKLRVLTRSEVSRASVG